MELYVLVWVVDPDLLFEICIFAVETRSCLRNLSNVFETKEVQMNHPIQVQIVY